MIYCISDIHGCYGKYLAMLEKINFSDGDILYVLGDVVDRGEHSIKVLFDMSMRANVFPIMGNHDYIALAMLGKLSEEITEQNYEPLDQDFLGILEAWLSDGGRATLEEFRRLPGYEREIVLDYLGQFAPYESVEANGKKFILAHSGIPESADLYECNMLDFITASTDYDKIYFADTFLVTGHTPTFFIDKDYENRIYRGNNNIAIDTGAVFGGPLSCLCLDTLEEYYVK